jgi:DNA primase
MMARLDLDAIRASNPLPAVVATVAKLRAVGGEWKACCPFHNERTPSFTIFDGGKRYQCFGCGAGGDVIDFVQALHGVGLRDAAAMLGAGELPVVEVSLHSAREPRSEDRTAEALAIWESAEPVEGTLAEAYLRRRGITIPAPMSLRYAELPYGRRGPTMPCLVACVSSPEGPLQGIQRTYLAADGNGKADVPAPKLSLGKLSGGAIRLAGHSGEVVVCEGMEDGLSLLQLIDRPVWVAAGASNLATMRFPATVERVTIGGDNDDAGKEAARKAAERLATQGVETRVFFPSPGFKDFNDQLRGCRA